MPYSTVTYTADGTETDYLITWNYLDTDHITVKVADVYTTDVGSTYQFSIIDPTTLRVTDLSNNPIANGIEIELKRSTPISNRAVTFAEGSALRTKDLNKNSDFLLYSMQEAIDTIDVAAQEGAATAKTGAETAQQLAETAQQLAESARDTAQTYLSTVQAAEANAISEAAVALSSANAAAASELQASTDAATVLSNISTAITKAAEALSSANAALVSEQAADVSEANALSYKNDAQTAKTESETARDTAQGYLTTVQTSANNASTSETNAATSEASASTSEANAATSASNALSSQNSAANSASNANSSKTNAAVSASNALSSQNSAANSASNAATSETNAATSLNTINNQVSLAEGALDSINEIYLGDAASAPTTTLNGNSITSGVMYFDTTADLMRIYNGSSWQDAASAINGTVNRELYTATSGQTTFNVIYDLGYLDVWMNGIKLIEGTDYTANTGTTMVLTSGATAGDLIDILAFGTFLLTDHYTNTQQDARFLQLSGGALTGNLTTNSLIDGRNVSSDGSTLDGLVNTVGSNTSDIATNATNIANNANAIAGKVNNSQVLTNVPSGAVFTDTVFSANYSDLSNKPTIPTNNNQLTNGRGYTTYSANQAVNTSSSPTFTTLNATTVDLGAWSVHENSGVLYFRHNGSNKMKLDSSGNMTVTGNVTAYGLV